tara:strand:+ start:4385 stop:5098 length:714 start_codon:yes stop_codon:yes gene_type:complete
LDEFKNIYKSTVQLFEKGDFEEDDWRDEITKNLIKLEKIWPETDNLDLEEELEDYIWRIEQIQKWSQLDEETIKDELYNHGSLFFYDIKDDLTDEQQDQILKKFWELTGDATKPNSTTLFRLAAGKLKGINKVKKSKQPKSKLDKTINELNKLEKHYWAKLYELSLDWEIDESLTKILKSLKKTNAKITKKDSEYFVDMLKYLIDKKYIFQIDEEDKTEVTTKIMFNTIIKVLNKHA